jgi:hypothetical protein
MGLKWWIKESSSWPNSWLLRATLIDLWIGRYEVERRALPLGSTEHKDPPRIPTLGRGTLPLVHVWLKKLRSLFASSKRGDEDWVVRCSECEFDDPPHPQDTLETWTRHLPPTFRAHLRRWTFGEFIHLRYGIHLDIKFIHIGLQRPCILHLY